MVFPRKILLSDLFGLHGLIRNLLGLWDNCSSILCWLTTSTRILALLGSKAVKLKSNVFIWRKELGDVLSSGIRRQDQIESNWDIGKRRVDGLL